MRVAIIDMGTNTFNLIIKNEEDDRVLYTDKIPVKLGEGGLGDGQILPAAMERAMKALTDFRQQARDFGVEELYALATSAVRSADNGQALVKRALTEQLVAVNVISGHREAELIYLGVRRAVNLGQQCQLIMDIGGGSVEFVMANGEQIFWRDSFELGSARLMGRFQPSDPITSGELNAIREFLQQELSPLWQACKQYSFSGLLGSSGSFETLAAMIMAQHGEAFSESNPHYGVALDDYRQMAEKMIHSTLEERLATPGMLAMRAPLMGLVCILINLVLEECTIEQLQLSTFALKEGVFYSLKENRSQWQKSSL